ncbi:TetR family transcriptional regulator [Quadrisphaera sp. KR29]|uniref:TetR family transcriptional regulator n=1 Tax=Quadrisphaera sp. KR29 TaxID=3461391 RepID=UPI004043DA86
MLNGSEAMVLSDVPARAATTSPTTSPTETEVTPGLRERARRAVVAELTAEAMALFLEHGFDATTVEQIASAAGISKRTFFRYFPTKNAVLAAAMQAPGRALVDDLVRRPHDEEPWLALRRCFDALVGQLGADERTLALTRMMLRSPDMNASHQDKHATWHAMLTTALIARIPSPADDPRWVAPADGVDEPDQDARHLRAQALAGSALACLTAAQNRWVDSDGALSLAVLLDVAMGAVHALPGAQLS